jgi:hypothetical protein
MNIATLGIIVTTIGKDNVVGFLFDNVRRAHRRKKDDGSFETFDERFLLDVDTGCVVVEETNITSGIKIKTYIPAEYVQGLTVIENADDIYKVDFRYILG